MVVTPPTNHREYRKFKNNISSMKFSKIRMNMCVMKYPGILKGIIYICFINANKKDR